MQPRLKVAGVGKTFTMHLHGGALLPAVANASFNVWPGECAVLGGPSGTGKSSLLKMVYGSYRCEQGQIWLRDGERWVDIACAPPRQLVALRRSTIGYVSQFLRAIPRLAAVDVVAEPLLALGRSRDESRSHAEAILRELNLPERLWSLPPATFSGGEQQRVNIARGLVAETPLLLLDEPTASLDSENRRLVIDLVRRRAQSGTAILAIAHDEDVRNSIAHRTIDVTTFSAAA